MKKRLTAGELKKALEGVDDNIEVELSSDSGVDQCGDGEVIVENAYYQKIHWGPTDNLNTFERFCIYCNTFYEEEEDYEDT